jgi:hypothetical protein
MHSMAEAMGTEPICRPPGCDGVAPTLRLADRVVGMYQAGETPPPGLARMGLQIDQVLGYQIEHLIEDELPPFF